MLIDELLSNKSWKQAGVIDSLRSRLAAAPKFVLRRDFAMAIDEIVHNNWVDNCNKVVPLCRLPYRECWMEVAQNDRIANRNYDHRTLREHEIKTKRIGWLLTQINDSGTWLAQMFWSFDINDTKFRETAVTDPDFWSDCPLGAAVVVIQFDPQAKNAEEAIGIYGPSDFSMQLANRSKTYASLDFRGSVTDWEGEGSFLMGALSLLNSKNVVESRPVSFVKKNKAAAKAGQLPLFEYHEISIHQRYTKRNMDPTAAGDGRKFRQHFCRAHFKIRKTGVFFWSAHRRGRLDLGFVGKDYEVRL